MKFDDFIDQKQAEFTGIQGMQGIEQDQDLVIGFNQKTSPKIYPSHPPHPCEKKVLKVELNPHSSDLIRVQLIIALKHYRMCLDSADFHRY
jgi:hypothetical protein